MHTREKIDQVNHPKHYTSHPSGIESIQITRHMNFNKGSAMKYIWRSGVKNPNREIEDIEKAIFHLTDEVKRLKGKHESIDSLEDKQLWDELNKLKEVK